MYYMCIVSNQLAVTNTNCQEQNPKVILYWGINCTFLCSAFYVCVWGGGGVWGGGKQL